MRGKARASSTRATSLCSPFKHPSFSAPVVSLRATRLPSLCIMVLLVVWLSYSIYLIASVSVVWNERSTSEVSALCSLFKTYWLTSYD
jgi:hypothetical protein